MFTNFSSFALSDYEDDYEKMSRERPDDLLAEERDDEVAKVTTRLVSNVDVNRQMLSRPCIVPWNRYVHLHLLVVFKQERLGRINIELFAYDHVRQLDNPQTLPYRKPARDRRLQRSPEGCRQFQNPFGIDTMVVDRVQVQCRTSTGDDLRRAGNGQMADGLLPRHQAPAA